MHNYLIYSGMLASAIKPHPLVVVPIEEGVVANLQSMPPETVVRNKIGLIVNGIGGKPFAIVHQYDRLPFPPPSLSSPIFDPALATIFRAVLPCNLEPGPLNRGCPTLGLPGFPNHSPLGPQTPPQTPGQSTGLTLKSGSSTFCSTRPSFRRPQTMHRGCSISGPICIGLPFRYRSKRQICLMSAA